MPDDSNSVRVYRIFLYVNGQRTELSVGAARALYDELGEIFGKSPATPVMESKDKPWITFKTDTDEWPVHWGMGPSPNTLNIHVNG